MNLLPPSTVRLIASSQVITSVSSVVKELVENSLDAGATSIEIKLDGWGLERIEVRDNGCGIKQDDAAFIAQPHYTSKISSDTDLKSLQTYGFRGEALGSLSSVSTLSVLTKTESEQVGMLYTIGRNGKLEATQPKPATTGTTVIVIDLFKNLPVRKQFSSNSKKCKDELRKVEDLLMAYGLMHPYLRISLRHNKVVVWQKNKVSDHRTALLSVFGTMLLAQMGAIEFQDEHDTGINVVGYLPRPGSDFEITGRAGNDRCFVFFNGRPVNMKPIYQLIRQYYTLYSRGTASASNKYPIAFLSIELPPDSLDVNLEPNKTSVMLTNKDELIRLLTNLLDEFYSDVKNRISESKATAPGNVTENGTVTSRNGLMVNKENYNGDEPKVQCTRNFGAINGKSADVELACISNGKHTVNLSNCKESWQETSICSLADENGSFENAQRGEHSEKAQSDDRCYSSKSMLNNTSNDANHFSREGTSCQKQSKANSQGKNACTDHHSPNSKAVTTLFNRQRDIVSPLSCVQPDETNTFPQVDSFVAGSLDSNAEVTVKKVNNYTGESGKGKEDMPCGPSFDTTELCELLSDETLSEISETDVVNKASSSCVTDNKKHQTVVLSSENGEDQMKAVDCNGCLGKCQEVLDDSLRMCTPSSNKSLEKLFSLDMDDLFDDSELDITWEKSTNKMSLPSNHVTSSTSDKSSVGGDKSEVTLPHAEDEAECSNKDWSRGNGIVDKQGNVLEPVTLVVPDRSCIKTPLRSLHSKRKRSSDESRLSLSSKKIKKIPEITNQPLITKIMSPNPMQRKVLYKKTEIPFCLNGLKDLAKNRGNEQRPVEQNSRSDCLIGRLDPWGVWLILREATDIVCINQYRIQEQLLFQRLMECHSLPKEIINHPITLNERIVGGPDCWRALCGMSSQCDAPDTTRFIDDERLTLNGFDVCLKTDSESGETKYEVFKMSSSIPFYGVPDLAEILELIHQNGDKECNRLSSYRPFKVVQYLQGEAVRMARSSSSRMNRSDVKDIISRMGKQIHQETRACVHGRPFFQTIAKIPSE